MSLFAAGVALLALLFASYSRRRTLFALGSMAMSMAALIGLLFVVTSHDQSQVQTRLAWVGSKLQPMLDRQTLGDLKTAIAWISTFLSCDAGQQAECRATASAASPEAGPEAIQATATTDWLETKQDPAPPKQKEDPAPPKQDSRATSQSPVAWQLGDPDVQVSSSGAEGFLIGGTNVSDQSLDEVRAALKPDSSQRQLELALEVEGHKFEDGTVIPAGARFSLVSESLNEEGAKQFGGAILTFRYVQAGQRKTSILYLSPSMVARFANRG